MLFDPSLPLSLEIHRFGGDDHGVARAMALAAELFDRAEKADADAAIAPATLRRLAASGLTLAMFSERHGGSDLLCPEKTTGLVSVLRLIGAADLSMARLFEGHVNAVALVTRYGGADQVAAFADAVRCGQISGVWNAEGRRPLTARRGPNGWILDGEKILASGLGLVERPIVTPKTADGVIMLLPQLPPNLPNDLSGWTSQGMRATATGTVDFSGFVVPYDAQIGVAGDYQRQPHFSGGAWRFCAVHLGAAEKLLDLFRAHLVERGRADDPYQQQRIALATAAIVSAALLVSKAARLVADEQGEPAEIVAFANLTRMVTERAALDVIEAVQRGIGLGAFMRPHPVERIVRDLATYLRQPVPDAAMADAARVVLNAKTSVADLWGI